MATKIAHIDRKKDKMYYVDKIGDVMETERNTKGGKKGSKHCTTKHSSAKKKPAAAKKAPKTKSKISALKRKYGVR